jgi:hypothetical protein
VMSLGDKAAATRKLKPAATGEVERSGQSQGMRYVRVPGFLRRTHGWRIAGMGMGRPQLIACARPERRRSARHPIRLPGDGANSVRLAHVHRSPLRRRIEPAGFTR